MKFSIITPSYCQTDWLQLCAASIRDQSDDGGGDGVEVEHIIQDAGSPDIEKFAIGIGAGFVRNGTEIVAATSCEASAASGHCKTVVHVERDRGMYDAINRGFSKATGEILAYLNCDEQYLPGTIRRVAEVFLKRPDVDVLFGDALLVDPDGEAMAYRRIIRPNRVHTRLVHLCTLSCAMFVRRRLVDGRISFPSDFRAIGDAVFVDHLLRARVRMITLPRPLAVYTVTGKNLSASRAAETESSAWRVSAPFPMWLRGPSIIHHRLRRFFAGGHRRRSGEYALFTHGNPACRKTFTYTSLGFNWPGS